MSLNKAKLTIQNECQDNAKVVHTLYVKNARRSLRSGKFLSVVHTLKLIAFSYKNNKCYSYFFEEYQYTIGVSENLAFVNKCIYSKYHLLRFNFCSSV